MINYVGISRNYIIILLTENKQRNRREHMVFYYGS